MKQTILVTGGTGFIGSHTTVELQQAGYKLAEIAYSTEQGAPGAGFDPSQAGAQPGNDGPIEADYEVVDDDKKEGK